MPLTRSQLRAIAERRRGDPDIKALLLEIKRLRALFDQASERAAGVMHYTENADLRHRLNLLGELFEDEADAFDPPDELRGQQDDPGRVVNGGDASGSERSALSFALAIAADARSEMKRPARGGPDRHSC